LYGRTIPRDSILQDKDIIELHMWPLWSAQTLLALCFGGSRATAILSEQDRSIAQVRRKHGLRLGKAAAGLPHSMDYPTRNE